MPGKRTGMIAIEPWPISQFIQTDDDGALNIHKDYQRRKVWNRTTQMRLIDSIARQVPAGAITMYEDESLGYKRYDVIDGKQRLSTILEYVHDEFVVSYSVIGIDPLDAEDLSELDSTLADAIEGKEWKDLKKPQRVALRQYKFPVFIVSGPRASAVQAFTRMNSILYSLKPQEIRNAVFAGTTFLGTVIRLTKELSVGTRHSFFVDLELMTKSSWLRMQDLQLASELLILCLAGRRRGAIP